MSKTAKAKNEKNQKEFNKKFQRAVRGDKKHYYNNLCKHTEDGKRHGQQEKASKNL